MYKTYSFMAEIDGTAKFFKFEASNKEGALADLRARYGEDADIKIYLWQVEA